MGVESGRSWCRVGGLPFGPRSVKVISCTAAGRAGCAEGLSETFLDRVEYHALIRPDKTAFTFLGDGTNETERLSYGGMRRHALGIAAALRRRGLRGAPVLLVFPPGLDVVLALLGCFYAGALAVPVPYPAPRRSGERINAIAGDAEPAAVLTLSRLMNDAARTALAPDIGEAGWIATDLVAAGGEADAGPLPRPEDIALLQYTSGSTLAPRGVAVTHGNLLHNQRMMASVFGHGPDSIGVNWVPAFHDMGLIGGVLQSIHCGGTSILLPPLKVLQHPRLWLQAISRYRGTASAAPTFAYELCVRRVRAAQCAELDLSCWDVAICGAEPVRAEVLDEFARVFASAGFSESAFVPAYGLAETTLLVAAAGKGTPLRRRAVDPGELALNRVRPSRDGSAKLLVSCGGPHFGQDVAIVEPTTGQLLPTGSVGEIWVAGGSVAHGYWKKAGETRAAFGNRLAGRAGRYLRTGDLGFVDADGLFVTGRLKELIVIHGRNLYPHDIEEVVRRCHPALADGVGAAFGIEDAGAETVVLAFEVARHAAREAASAGLLEAAAAAVLRSFGVRLHDLVLLRPGGLPRTTSGKVRRGRCRELYLAGELPALGALFEHPGLISRRLRSLGEAAHARE